MKIEEMRKIFECADCAKKIKAGEKEFLQDWIKYGFSSYGEDYGPFYYCPTCWNKRR